MKGLRRRYLIAGVFIGAVLGPCPSNAQYTADFQTNIISGVVSNWSGGYTVGNSHSADALFIQAGGVLSNIGAGIGFDGNSNLVVVSDNNSAWIITRILQMGDQGSGNELIITNGGAVYSGTGQVGFGGYSTGNVAVVTGSGSVWSIGSAPAGAANGVRPLWAGGETNGDLIIGDGNSIGNQLTIANGGVVADKDGYLGSYDNTSNTVLVTGSGSLWNNRSDMCVGSNSAYNTLIITNGAAVYDNNGFIGINSRNNNTVLVTGSGSVWSNRANLYLGSNALGCTLTITNGATVYDNNAFLKSHSDWPPDGSQVWISGSGATWWNQGNLYVGGPGSSLGNGYGNTVNIGTGGTVIASNVYVYAGVGAGIQDRNGITLSGGILYVTNSLHNGVLDLNAGPPLASPSVYGGILTLNSGTVTVDSLVLTNFAPNKYTTGGVRFNGGLLSTKSTIISNDQSPYVLVFVVGNGTNNATLQLATGGTGFHLFEAGLTIASNAMLTGIGTVIGTTTIKAGGTLAPGDGPGSITFSNNLTLAAGSTLALTLNGTGAGQYSQIAGLGTISISNSVLSVSLGYMPSPGDSFTIISNLTTMAVLGTFVDTAGAALPNGADFVVDNIIFQIDYSANCDGLDVVLTALIPEPSSLLLTALGAVSLCAILRRRRL